MPLARIIRTTSGAAMKATKACADPLCRLLEEIPAA
jgi:hypothetical protein